MFLKKPWIYSIYHIDIYIYIYIYIYSRVGAGGAGCESAPLKFWFFKNLGKTSKIRGKEFRYFLTILKKLCFFLTECINKSYYPRENTLKTYKINELFLVNLRFSLWELMSNRLTWKFGQKKAFHLCALLIVHWSNRLCCRAHISFL